MKPRLSMPVFLVAMLLCGCVRFSQSSFIEKGFGFDLSPYLEQHEWSYEDGLLEVYGVAPNDELHAKMFPDNSGMHEEPTFFTLDDRRYSATQYVMIGSFDGFMKFALYLQEEKTMVFIYADGSGG